MNRQQQTFPSDSLEWLLQPFGLEPGDEASDAVLEPLYGFQQAWVAKGGPEDIASLYDEATLRAYTLFYMPVNMPKLWFMLDRSFPMLEKAFAKAGAVRVVDAGCGPGTFAWALVFYLRLHRPAWLSRLELVCIDRHAGFLNIAEALAQGLGRWGDCKGVTVSVEQGDWRELAPSADLLILGNTVTEQTGDLSEWLGKQQVEHVIMIEPGTERNFRQVLPLRDQLLAAGWSVVFPCASSQACPMASGNWCHFNVNRLQLPFIQRMANRAKRLNPKHHFTGFVFSREAVVDAGGWRVLSSLRKAHRSGIRWVCDGGNMVEAVLGRRAKTDKNLPFMEAEAGDLLAISGKGQLKTRGRIERWQSIDIVTRRPDGEA